LLEISHLRVLGLLEVYGGFSKRKIWGENIFLFFLAKLAI